MELLSDNQTPQRAQLLGATIELFDGAGYLSSKYPWRHTDAATLHRNVRNAFVAGLPVYVELLSSDDEALRRAAARAMCFAPSPQSIPALKTQLQREISGDVIAAILEAMVPLRPVDGASIGRSRLESNDPGIRVRAAQLLAVCELPFPNDGLSELCDIGLTAGPSRPQSGQAYSAIVSIGGLEPAAEIWMERAANVADEDLHDYYRTAGSDGGLCCCDASSIWTFSPVKK